MIKAAAYLLVIVLGSSMLTSCEREIGNKVQVIAATGDIRSKMEEFRKLLGSQLNTAPGSIGGHREINWDGVPTEWLDTPLPADFFNQVGPSASAAQQRGLLYTADGGGDFEVSRANFSEINPAAAPQFKAFSGEQTFSNINGNLWDVGFQVAGKTIPASVKGFGIVFSDVDVANDSWMEFYDGNINLGRFFVPPHDASSTFSFLGVYFKDRKVTRVEVSHGSGALNSGQKDISNGGPKDLVILDDFLYDEPVSR